MVAAVVANNEAMACKKQDNSAAITAAATEEASCMLLSKGQRGAQTCGLWERLMRQPRFNMVAAVAFVVAVLALIRKRR